MNFVDSSTNFLNYIRASRYLSREAQWQSDLKCCAIKRIKNNKASSYFCDKTGSPIFQARSLDLKLFLKLSPASTFIGQLISGQSIPI